jgi:ParB-like chromosome segregation protein Spo0J
LTTEHEIIERNELIDPNALIPHPDNSMTHGDAQVTQLVASFEQFGFNGVIVIDEDNVVLAGHGRRLAAIRMGLPAVPCMRRVGLTDAQKRAYIIIDNDLGRAGEYDDAIRNAQLALVSDAGFDLAQFGISTEALAAALVDGADSAAPAESSAPAVKRRRGIAAIDDAIAERERQINVEGWTPAHDDKHANGELVDAAVYYLSAARSGAFELPAGWPLPAEWWKPSSARRNLIKGIALALAELERMDRGAARTAAIAKAATEAAAKAAERAAARFDGAGKKKPAK